MKCPRLLPMINLSSPVLGYALEILSTPARKKKKHHTKVLGSAQFAEDAQIALN